MDAMKIDIEYKDPEDYSPEVRRVVMNIIHRNAIDETPDNIPEAREKVAQVILYVDINHVGNKVTRRSQTGILIFLYIAPILWYSKKQNTCVISTFGSEYVALNIATEKLIALGYEILVTGVPFEEPVNILCNNESTIKNMINIEYELSNKNVYIVYHTC